MMLAVHILLVLSALCCWAAVMLAWCRWRARREEMRRAVETRKVDA